MSLPGVAIQISTPGGGNGRETSAPSETTTVTLWSYQTSLQVTDLGPFGSAAVDAGGLEARSSAVFLSHLLHLLRKLTSRGENQTLETTENQH